MVAASASQSQIDKQLRGEEPLKDRSGQQPGASSSAWQTIPDDAEVDQPTDDEDDLGRSNPYSKKTTTKDRAGRRDGS